jgi:predicted NUDIX family NTP pyrophosphohydrolase
VRCCSAASPNKEDANKWNIQGGAALAGEDSLTAAVRENREDCGIIHDISNAELLMSNTKGTEFYDIWLFQQEF